MGASGFIAERLRFKGRIATAATALSALVVTVAVCVSAGFRTELRSEVSTVLAFSPDPSLCASVPGTPVLIRPGVLKCGGRIEGVLFQGDSSLPAQSLVVPERLAARLDAAPGSRMQAYFISSDKVKARAFEVDSVAKESVQIGSEFTVFASEQVLRRLSGLREGEWDAVRVQTGAAGLSGYYEAVRRLEDLGFEVDNPAGNPAPMYEWLAMIDANVLAILSLMIVVAAFNMITGMLIMLTRQTRMIGILKTLGMTDRGIAKVFLGVGSRAAGIGLAAGTLSGLLLCFVQMKTRFVRLDPANYFLSYVPISIDAPATVSAIVIAWAVISILLLIPCRMISKTDPSKTIKSE